jgi:predicted aconitase
MLYLNIQEERMLNGEEGPTIQKAMELLVRMGEANDAKRMVDVTNAHILSVEIADIFFEVTYGMLANAKVKIPTTTNPITINSVERARQMGIPKDIIDAQWPGICRLKDLHNRAGMIPAYTCHPHSLKDLKMGEYVAFTEFNVVPLANAWFGVRTNLHGQTDTLASAITGKAPECGLHLTENRWGKLLIEVDKEFGLEDFDSAFYGALGYWAGQVCVDRIPVFVGLPKEMTYRAAEYLGVGPLVRGSVGMFHIPGVTPEAPTLEAAFGGRRPEDKFVFGKKELKMVYEELNTTTKSEIDMVCLGCPHCSLQELIVIARLIDGKKVSENVRLWIATSEINYMLAERMGFISCIERAGGFVNSNICAGTFFLLRFTDSLGVKVVANNGLTLSGLVPRGTRGKVGVHFGSLEKCVNAAITGKWEEK